MTKLTALAIAVFLLSPQLAQAEKLTITVRQATEVLVGLVALDGYDRVVKDGAQEKIVKEPYKLGSGLRLAIAKNLVTLRTVISPIQLAYQGKQNELTHGGKDPVTPEIQRELADTDLRLTAEKQEIDLTKIKVSELGLDTNPIPPSVIAQLTPILLE